MRVCVRVRVRVRVGSGWVVVFCRVLQKNKNPTLRMWGTKAITSKRETQLSFRVAFTDNA